MIYTVRHFMYMVYPFISHIGFTKAVPPYVFMAAINHALNFIYAHWGYTWSRQHWKDAYNFIWWNRVTIQTTWWIQKVDQFFCWDMEPIVCLDCDKGNCLLITDCKTPINCCTSEWTEIDMEEKSPHSQLTPWSYQINNDPYYYNPDWPWCRYSHEDPNMNWTEVISDCDDCSVQPQWVLCGMGWIWWNRIEAMLPMNCWCTCNQECKGLWVSYYRAPQHFTSFKDYIYLPENFITPLAWLTAHFLLPSHGQSRQYDDVNYYNRAVDMLNNLKKFETSMPWTLATSR